MIPSLGAEINFFNAILLEHEKFNLTDTEFLWCLSMINLIKSKLQNGKNQEHVTSVACKIISYASVPQCFELKCISLWGMVN